MKVKSISVILALVLGLAYQAAAKGAVALPVNIFADSTDGCLDTETWNQVLPTGVVVPFSPPQGQVMVARTVFVTFYADAPSDGPFLFLFETTGPSPVRFYTAVLNPFHNGSGKCIGGYLETTITPGMACSAQAVAKMTKPNDFYGGLYDGPVVPGSLRVRVIGELK